MELLFERLAARWVIAGAPIERQRELLARLARLPGEREWVRATLREHCAEHFPDVARPEGQRPLAEQFKAGAMAPEAETKRAVAGLSTNSSTAPSSPRTSRRRPSS